MTPLNPALQGVKISTSTCFLLQDSIYFAYFPPYSYARHQQLVAKSHAKKNVRLDVIGETLDGHDLDVLRIGEHMGHTCTHFVRSLLFNTAGEM